MERKNIDRKIWISKEFLENFWNDLKARGNNKVRGPHRTPKDQPFEHVFWLIFTTYIYYLYWPAIWPAKHEWRLNMTSKMVTCRCHRSNPILPKIPCSSRGLLFWSMYFTFVNPINFSNKRVKNEIGFHCKIGEQNMYVLQVWVLGMITITDFIGTKSYIWNGYFFQ